MLICQLFCQLFIFFPDGIQNCWQMKTKYRKFLSIVYSNAGIALIDDFYKKLYPHKANLREIHNLFVTKYGQEKGTEYYRYYKSHAEFLQKTF